MPDDESLDSVEPLRIQIDDSLIEDPIEIKEFADSAVLFDDIDVIPDKKIREAVLKLMNLALEVGRHYRINMVSANHLPSNGRDSRRVLNEASSFTYFPHSANAKIKYFLTEYVGVDKKMITCLSVCPSVRPSVRPSVCSFVRSFVFSYSFVRLYV